MGTGRDGTFQLTANTAPTEADPEKGRIFWDNDVKLFRQIDDAGVILPIMGSGDVSGPGSSTDNALTRWNGTTGDIIQNSSVILDDSDNISGVNILSVNQQGIGTTTPASSALLDLTSTTQALLVPRMTTIQRDAIVSPVEGLEIFNTTTKEPQYYGGESWVNQAGAETLTEVLNRGNGTGGTSIILESDAPVVSPIGEDLNIYAGNRSVNVGGYVNILGGDQVGGTSAGGVIIAAGSGAGGSKAGDTILRGGSSAPTCGDAYVQGGIQSSGDSHGGDVYIQGSDAGLASSQKTGGSVTISGGTGTGGTNGRGGNIDISAGAQAKINLTVDGVSSGGDDGSINLTSGAGGGGFPGSNLTITTGAGSGNASGGTLALKAGGSAGNSDGGSITIDAGYSTGLGGYGDILLQSVGGSVGIGGIPHTTSKFHVELGNSGGTPAANSVMSLESSADGFMTIMAPDFSSTGVLFGTPSDDSYAGIHSRVAEDRIEIRAGGNSTKMTIQGDGKVGIGTDSPSSQLQLKGSMTVILTGTVDIESGNNLISGLGSAFTTELVVGQAIKINSVVYIVSSITSDTIMFTTVAPTQTLFGLDVYVDPPLFTINNGNDTEYVSVDEFGTMHIAKNIKLANNGEIDWSGGEFVITHDGWDTSLTQSVGDLTLRLTNPNDVIVELGGTVQSTSFHVDDNVSNKLFQVLGDGRVGINTTPETSAQLSIASTNKGFLLPRMTEAQFVNIGTPAEALQLYDTDSHLLKMHDDTRWRSITDPTNVISISSQEDWDDLIILGEITISVGTTLLIKTLITTDAEIVVNDGIPLSIIGNRISTAGIIYNGGGTFITSDGCTFLRIDGINTIDGNSTGTLYNITHSSIFVEISNSGCFNWASYGTIAESSQFRVVSVGFFYSGAGFTLDHIDKMFVAGPVMQNGASMNSAFFKVLSNHNPIMGTFTGCAFPTLSGESLVRIDPGIDNMSRIVVTDNAVTGAGTLYAVNGITGTFTVTSDASISSTAITSVVSTGDAHSAKFHHSGSDPYIGQQVVLSGFVVNTAYNGTWIVANTATGGFTLEDVAFGSNESVGSFTSTAVTVTDTATTLVDGDTITLDTDNSSVYDGGAAIYNKTTNTFQINRTFSASHSGTWNTSGITQKDPRVLGSLNPDYIDSGYIATAFVNANATSNGTIVNNTFTDMVFGTSGSALVSASTMERWKLIDDVNGIFEYTGNEPFSGYITFDFTVDSSGGTVDFRFKWQKDTGSGFADLEDDVEALVAVGSESESVTKTYPLSVTMGDQIKPQITRNSGISTIMTTYATIYATK